jgi:DNA-directed RNA polymerase subunit beta
MLGRVQAFSALIQGNKIPGPTVPETFKLLVRKLNGLGLGLEAFSTEDSLVEDKEEDSGDSKQEKTTNWNEADNLADQGEAILDEKDLRKEGLEEINDYENEDEKNS